MKKAFVLITVCVLISVLLCACGKQVGETKPADLPYGSDTGTGTMYLSYVSGTTENNNIIDILVNKDTHSKQIGINAFDFDGSHFSFVYIDGVLYGKEQYGNTQSSLDLKDVFLSEGNHIVSVVQYDSNEENGNIVTYKEAKYNIVY